MTAASMSTDDSWTEANQRYVSASLGVLKHIVGRSHEEADREETDGGDLLRLEEERVASRDAMSEPPALDRIASALALSDFERDVLLLCAGVELDSSVAAACATAHGDPVHRHATFGLTLAALPDAHWSALSPAAPLRRWHLVDLVHPQLPTTSPLRIDERVLHALAGLAYLDPRLSPLVRPVQVPEALPAALGDAAGRLASLWSDRGAHPHVQLHGPQRSDLLAVAAAGCTRAGLRPVRVRTADLHLPSAPSDRELLARLCERETVLGAVAWLLDVDEPEQAASALDFAAGTDAPLVLLAREPLCGPDSRPRGIAVSRLSPSDTRDAWTHALGTGTALRLHGGLDRVIGQFDLGVEAMRAAAEEVDRSLPAEAAGRQLWQACAAQARPTLDALTQRITPRATWGDLVLPAPQTEALHQLSAHARHRLRVLHDWGFAARGGRGLGTSALFAGPSGTGKTLAAEALAADLDLDLYRIDLSQVVSKYIGETEKNLRSVFDAAEAGGAVLLFDEADALFGKRSEVKDSHDRYANIEVSYLLQRMETYRGIAVLTTNLKDSLDSAFLRRLRFVVHFPFPDEELRAGIWRRAFPGSTPIDGLDPELLASLTITGGSIANIALSAAFLAAEDDLPVGTHHVLAAARTEYAKLEKVLTDTEVRGWVRPDDEALNPRSGGPRHRLDLADSPRRSEKH
ncbi:ATP-binding protein [Streptomyces durmitorensis]|uniref:ATP-binding protein n=1 Tax=Streptomyces durmitorensis TaxID=319947 RepID=A0ABY4Q4S0_9ACTN|nr:ATP-binding protein [Streptomyces durmitorensis]UQT60695.1 ATP-binding protein [Streptomyces durmitorensis]